MSICKRIGTGPVAMKVKLSDPNHSMDASRYCRPLNDYERKREEISTMNMGGFLCQTAHVEHGLDFGCSKL